MSSPSEALGGPVLAWETKRSTARKLWRVLPIAYCAWLVLQTVLSFTAVVSASRKIGIDTDSRLVSNLTINTMQMQFIDNYFALLLKYQLVLLVALIPAFVAGSLGQEKERGTLFALFGTELTSREILLGKLLGRLVLIVPLALTSVPALVFMASFTGRGMPLLLLALSQEVIIAIAVAAACLLFGIWIRKATDAVVASYLFLGLGYLAISELTDALPAVYWFDPVENLRKLLSGGSWLVFVAHLAVWACLGALCLRLGWGRLRKVCVEQRDKRPSRRLWAFRPAVGNNPFRWRECYVIGLAPMPILRIVPRWLALLAVFTASAAFAGLLANNIAPGFINEVLSLKPVRAFAELRARQYEIKNSVPAMGLVFVLLCNLLIGLRCGTSVAEEKRRNTWDELLLTAQSFREVTTGKMWGVLQAVVPYVIAYALQVLFSRLWEGRQRCSSGGCGSAFPVLLCSSAHFRALT